MKKWLAVMAFVFTTGAFAQDLSQTIRGQVVDQVTGEPLVGATIQVINSETGSITDNNGNYSFTLPTGRYQLMVSYLGFQPVIKKEVLVTASKEVVLDFELVYASKALEEVVVSAGSPVTNIGSREITIEQTQRYAATFYDPARLVQSLPAASSTNDQNNNISVRGVSPSWNQWYLEGVEIANPNHTTNAGTFSDQPTQNGGGVNILSAQMLATSNFLYQTYGSQYGNSLGGIFDMSLRSGNNQRKEYTAQASLIGLDFSTEGPIASGGASYLINYRYSFTGLLAAMGVDFGGESISFQDVAFNLNFPLDKGNVKVFGMAGISENDFKRPEDPEEVEEEKDFYNINYKGKMGAVGTQWEQQLSDKLSLSKTLIYSLNHASRDQELDSIIGGEPNLSYDNQRNIDKLSGNLSIKTRINAKADLTTGISYVLQLADLHTTRVSIFGGDEEIVRDVDQHQWLWQPYISYHQLLGETVDLEAGLRYMYHDLSGDAELLPRLSLGYWFSSQDRLTATMAFLGQMNSTDVQFGYRDGIGEYPNKELPLMESRNFSLAYTRMMKKSTLETELFYNNYDHVPIGNFGSGPAFLGMGIYSTFNEDGVAPPFELIAAGTANTYGIDVRLEQQLQSSWYYLIGGTFYRSNYEAPDGNTYDSRWDGQYSLNSTFGKEIIRSPKKGKNRSVNLNARVIYQGGFRESPLDQEMSNASGMEVYQYNEPWAYQTPDFFRIDFRVAWRVEKERYHRSLSLDIQNVLNYENYAFRYFDNFTGRIERKNQLSLIPLLTYRVEF